MKNEFIDYLEEKRLYYIKSFENLPNYLKWFHKKFKTKRYWWYKFSLQANKQ